LQSPLTIFERQIKNITLRWFDYAEDEAIHRRANAEIIGEPAFAEFWSGTEKRHAFGWNDLRNNAFH
jgi:hypothetical protein